jgi:hypothetical protein
MGLDAGKVKLAVGDVQVEDRSLRIARMLDAFFNPGGKDAEGKIYDRVHSFKECYIEITGDKRVTGRIENCDRARLAESVGAAFRESVDTAAFSNVLGSSLTRRMVQDYNNVTEYDGYRQIVGTPVPLNDFRTQERVRFGGYGDLATVAQGSAYPALASPTDEKATYAPAKRGGTEDVTLEAIKNDDVGAIRRIPLKMARAAKRTLAKFVFDFVRTNPTIYDSVAFFHASHGNLGSTAFSAAEYGVVRIAMGKQTELNSADRLGIYPAIILYPLDLQEPVWNAFQRNTNLDKTFVQQLNPTLVPVWYWTDTNDWAAFANPNDLQTIELGFLDGQEEPRSSCRTCRTWARCSRTTSSPTRSATSTAATSSTSAAPTRRSCSGRLITPPRPEQHPVSPAASDRRGAEPGSGPRARQPPGEHALETAFKSLYTRIERLALAVAIAAFLSLNVALPPKAEAAVTNYPLGAHVVVIPLHITGAVSATTAGIVKFNMPFACDLVGVGASAQAISGTTNTVDVKLGGVSVLSSAITIAAAGTYTEGTIATTAITDEGVITVDITIAGTSLTHTTVLLTCVRK